MQEPKPGLPMTKASNMVLPFIADLGDGWSLVAHPDGAGIANECSMFVLNIPSVETHVPERVRAAAVEAFEKLTWPLVRDQFYD